MKRTADTVLKKFLNYVLFYQEPEPEPDNKFPEPEPPKNRPAPKPGDPQPCFRLIKCLNLPTQIQILSRLKTWKQPMFDVKLNQIALKTIPVM